MNNYLQITIGIRDSLQADMLVAQLSAMGFEGFEETEHDLHAYVPEQEFDKASFERLVAAQHLQLTSKIIGPTNWNEEWERNFQPIILGDFCAIRAAFHQPVPDVRYEIIITPKMSFGTGHHATTWLMLETMSRLNFTGKRILDFGTGTGILAILAEKLGSDRVLAIDLDAGCLENARENIAENQCHRIEVALSDNLDNLGSFDIVLANLNRNTLLSNMESVRQHLAVEGVVLMSGLLTEDLGEIRQEAARKGFIIGHTEQRDNWLLLTLSKATVTHGE